MPRLLTGTCVAFALCAASLIAQENIQRGKVKKADAAKGIVTITVDGKDQDFHATAATKFIGATNQESPKGIRDLKQGDSVMFKAESRDGKRILIGLKIGGDAGPAGKPSGGIREGTVQKLDLEKKLLTLKIAGKEQVFTLADQIQVPGGAGKDLQERLKGFKQGSEVFFKTEKRGGQEVVVGLKLAEGRPGLRPGNLPKADTSKLKPLTELATGAYQGFQGGLYPDGKNERPAAHEAAGLALARQVRPLDVYGKPSAKGKIVLLSIGMSNTGQSWRGFEEQLTRERDKNSKLVTFDGAQGGMTAAAIQDPDDNRTGTQYWNGLDGRLEGVGVTRAQVQAIWIKEADAGPTEGFPGYARKLQGELTRIVQLLPARFPNLKLVYLSSRTYAGYARSSLNPEPYAYESGFAVKWLIEQQLKGDPSLNYDPAKGPVKAPWLGWGPYLWANGLTKRADGFFYEESDFGNDGTHQSPSGQQKIGKLLLQFFKTDATTRPWFLERGAKRAARTLDSRKFNTRTLDNRLVNQIPYFNRGTPCPDWSCNFEIGSLSRVSAANRGRGPCLITGDWRCRQRHT
jgi:Cu/Ag efflux protein CusF